MFYDFDRFRLDAGKRLLLRDGKAVPLSAKAFDILAVLVQEHGRPFSKDELMRRVWADAVVEENNLTVNISALRRALGEHPGDHRFIVTLPGRGYQCVTEVREVVDHPVPAIDTSGSPWKHVAVALLAVVAGSVLLMIYARPGTDTRAQRPLAVRPVNPEAHALYIKGRFFWSKRSQEGIAKAIDYFGQAVDKDPDYALAYSGLADSYFLLASGSLPPREAMSKARKAASRALELDDTLAEAHSSIANIKRLDDFDWDGAEREFKRALDLDPAYAPAHQGYAILLSALGRHDEAIAEARRARELEPTSSVMVKVVARVLYEGRRYDDAIAAYRETLEMDPDFSQAQREIGLAYEQKGMFDAAEVALKRTITLPGTYFKATAMADLAHLYAARGDLTASRQMLTELQRMAAQTYVPSYDIAVVHAGLGERDQALASLQKAYADRSYWMVWLGVDPRFDALRADPAFVELERRVGLPGR